jgi:hypothetical protein
LSMNEQRVTPSSNHPLGAARYWRRRLLLHHAPLALLSAVVLVLFVTLPSFDANAYLHPDLRSGTFPKAATVRAGWITAMIKRGRRMITAAV